MGSMLGATRALTEEERARVRVVMVTVDPERDTPEVMARYAAHFDASFIGLSGSVEEVAQVLRDWEVTVHRGEPGASGSYFMSHPAHVEVIDSRRRMRLEIPGDATPAQFAADIRILLDEI
jgi:protein SCO1/2